MQTVRIYYETVLEGRGYSWSTVLQEEVIKDPRNSPETGAVGDNKDTHDLPVGRTLFFDNGAVSS